MREGDTHPAIVFVTIERDTLAKSTEARSLREGERHEKERDGNKERERWK